MKEQFKKDCEMIDRFVSAALPQADNDYSVIFESMRYSAENGGKRIRPYLTLSFCRMFGGDEKDALVLGTALEFIHTYSLIHDDLPCMDDDDLRRGKPTNHKVYGEATATLAGDALLTYAFEYITESELKPETKLKAITYLAKNAGVYGMIGGQVLDMMGEQDPLSPKLHLKMNALKTGCLIKIAAVLGIIAAENTVKVPEGALEAAIKYADGIGLAFQITDDLLDVYGDEAVFGKPIGSDAENGKTTFITIYTAEGARQKAKELTEEACGAIIGFENSERLCFLANMLLTREK